ncbi:MAG: hypothetical protein KGJ66_03980 [Alphaproteobacteria bacterium]|nr:hypothetical protein [Alphaproteobacteria bacterium]
MQFKDQLISLASAMVLLGIGYLFQARARLVWAHAHSFVFLLQAQGQAATPIPQNFNVYTASVYIGNLGRRVSATEVEVTFNWEPPNYNIWPVRPYNVRHNPDGRFTLIFPNLAPQEQFQIELLSANNQLPSVLNVRSKECVGRRIQMRPMRAFPSWFNVTVVTLLILGIAAIFYVVIELIRLA